MDSLAQAPINLTSTVSDTPTDLNFDTLGNTAPVDPTVADDRAQKYDVAMADQSPGIDALRSSITSGSDKHLRGALVAQKDLEDQTHRMGIIQKIAASRQGPLSQEELDVIRGLKADPGGRSPDTILEQEYGRKFWNTVLTVSPMMDPLLRDLAKNNDDYMFWLTDQFSDIKAKQEVTLRVAQDGAARYKQEGWTGWVGNELLNFVPGYSMWSTSRMAPGVKGEHFLPGSALAQKIQNLHHMNPVDYERTLTTEFNKLYDKNPNEAMRFIEAVQKYSSSDKFYGDVFSLFDIGISGQQIISHIGAKIATTGAELSGRLMTDAELGGARVGTGMVIGADRAARTVRTPRSMTQSELIRAGQVVNGDPFPQSFTPDALKKMGEKFSPDGKIISDATPRDMTLREIERARGGPTSKSRDFTPDEIGDMGLRLQAARAYIDILKAGSTTKLDPAKTLAGAGDLGPSGVLQAAREVAANMQGKQAITNFSERAQSILNPVGRLDDATSLSAEVTKRHSLNWQQNAKMLVDAIIDPVKVRRTPDVALVAGLKEAESRWKDLYRGPDDAILDVRWNLGRAPESVDNFAPKTTSKNLTLGNVENENSVSFILGRRDGTLFESKANAEFTANLQYKLGKDGYTVEQQGGGWYIKANKAVDETSPAVRNLLLQTEAETPRSWVNMFLGMMRSSNDVTSLLNSESRKLVTHGAQSMQAVMAQVAKQIGTLNREEFKNMKRFFALDRDWHGPDLVPGRFLDTVGQFETEYSNVFKKMPSEKETAAYFAYRQLNDFDWIVRNLGMYRDLSRQGVENVRFRWANRETGDKIWSDYFMAKRVNEVPMRPNDPAAGVYVFDTGTGKGKTFRTTKMDATNVAEIKRKIAEDGYKVYQIANPLDRPLRAQAGVNDYVNFIVVKDSTTAGLSHDLIPYHPGGHREYATTWFAKQADIAKMAGRFNYQGDRTLLGQYSEAEARRYVTALNTARELYIAKSPLFDAHVSANLPAEWGPKEVRKKFASREWDANEPFHVTYTGQTVKDVDAVGLKTRYGDKLHDEMNSPYNVFSQVDKKFVGSRDPSLKSIREQGSEDQPLLSLVDTPVIDPLRSLNRTVSNVVHQRMISDYKWQSVEAFIANHAGVLDVSQETLRQNPVYWLMSPLKFRTGADATQVAAAKADRAAILNFLGMDSPDVRALKWLQNKALSTIYEKLGQGASNYVAEHLLSTVTDPTKYARALAFHTKMGMFNPVQWLNQLQTLTHVTALAGPVTAGKAIAGSALMNMLRFTENPDVIAHFAKISTKFGWTEEQFTHSYQQLRRSGWNKVQGETSWRDDVADPNMFKSAWGKFLDAGTIFFTEGERFTRMAAWNAAYLEHSKSIPISKFNDQTLQKVLSRADLMNVNMTRASSSPLQQGLVGTSTQFLTYQARLFEQMWGGRLTQMEKARVLATYSAMYGIPATTGIAVGVWPMYDSIRTSALERGLNWDEDKTKVVMEGLPAQMLFWITGKDVNYAERFGPQGVASVSDVLKGNKQWWELFTGVSGSTIRDMGTALHPVMASLWSAVTGKSDAFPFVIEDLTDAAKSVTSVNNALKAVYAANYHKYLTKSGVPIADADKTDAILTAAFGLTRRDIADVFREMSSSKLLKQAQDEMQKAVVTEMRRALQSAAVNDEAAAKRYVARAQQYFKMGDFQPQQWSTILHQAATPGDTMDRVKFDFFFKKAPASQIQDRMKQLGVP